jgi:spore maturation protein CgeB
LKILCALGEYQYGDEKLGIGTEYAAFLPTLERMGHTIDHFETWDRELYTDFAQLNEQLLEYVIRTKPDVLLTVLLHFELWTETFDAIRDLGVVTICWTTDDSWKYAKVSKFVGQHFDIITTTYPSVVPRYLEDGIEQVVLTQWAADSRSLHPPKLARDCKHLVSFVGAAHGNRAERVAALQARGVNVECFGRGWPSGSIDAEDIPRIMRDSVISLNFANSQGENQIKARTFEVPGAGGFLVTDGAAGIENLYEPDREIVIVHDDDDLVARVKHFLARFEERDEIARRGFERTKRDHVYEARFAAILKVAESRRAAKQPVLESEVRRVWTHARSGHSMTLVLRALRDVLIWGGTLIWGSKRGPRAARQFVFEASRRIFGAKTFSAVGLPGRMFYRES